MCEFFSVEFGKFRKFFGVNFGCFCDFKILNLREFLVVFLKKITKIREFLGANFLRVVRHCERTTRRSVAIHYLTKSRFKYEFTTQKRTACVMDCFEPNGSRNDELFAFFTRLKNLLPNKFQRLFRKNFLNSHKNLPPNLKQNFKSKYQKTKPQFLYLNSFKRQVNA